MRIWIGIGLLYLASTAYGKDALSPMVRSPGIKEIVLIHLSHTDLGFTDHPLVCRELYRRYLDVAVDAVRDTSNAPAAKRFFWTAETTLPVNDWWQAASAEAKAQFLARSAPADWNIRRWPSNNTPFQNAQQWGKRWSTGCPKTFGEKCGRGSPYRTTSTAFRERRRWPCLTAEFTISGQASTATAAAPLSRGISAFWWRMPDGRRMFVWVGDTYPSGYDFFERRSGVAGRSPRRRHPIPSAARGRVVSRRRGFVRAPTAAARRRFRPWRRPGIAMTFLRCATRTNGEVDDDPPFPPLADFVAGWNRLGLEPRIALDHRLRRDTAFRGGHGADRPGILGRMDRLVGQWGGFLAARIGRQPRRQAGRWPPPNRRYGGRWTPAAAKPSTNSIATSAFSTNTPGARRLASPAVQPRHDRTVHRKERSRLSANGSAEWLLAQRARCKLIDQGEGIFVANPCKAAYTGWVKLIATCLREPCTCVEDAKTGERFQLYFEPGVAPWVRPQTPADLSREDVSATFPDNAPNKMAKFWVENLDGESIRRLWLAQESAFAVANRRDPKIGKDELGWPTSIQDASMPTAVSSPVLAILWPLRRRDLPPAGRWPTFAPPARKPATSSAARRSWRAAVAAEKAVVEENPHSIVIRQALRHPRLQWATRTLEIFREPAGEHVRYTLRINRLASAAPEVFYVEFPLPTGELLPHLSNGGMAFTPFTDQLPGTCRDYFAIDGWADYATPQGRWLWVSRDAPLLAFGESPTMALRTAPPKDVHRLRSMIYNNFWYTNFLADCPGVMEFQYDLVWRPDAGEPAGEIAEALTSPPVVLFNPAMKEDRRILRDLHRP